MPPTLEALSVIVNIQVPSLSFIVLNFYVLDVLTHRRAKVEWDLVQLSYSSRTTPRTISVWAFSISKDEDSTTSLDNLCWCSLMLRAKQKLVSWCLKKNCASVWAHCLLSCHCIQLKRAWLHFLCILLSEVYTLTKSLPRAFRLTGLHSVDLLSYDRYFSPLILLVAPWCTPSSKLMSLFYGGS